ncbi:MAG: serine--tRNA ligase [Pseudonocardiales bacterium]|nr:MAG: serine--tRNA ligase [Pseudonocardiales bacterium]
MIDIRLVRDDPDRVRASQRHRGENPATVDVLLSADERRRSAVATADDLRAEQRALGRKVGQADPAERQHLLEHAKQLAAAVRDAEAQLADAEGALRRAHAGIANVVIDGVPAGGEENFVTLETVGEKPEYGFGVREHVDVGIDLGAFDLERGAKVSGARFYFLTGPGAQLQFALLALAMEQATRAGFTPVVAPALVRPPAMEGTGYLGAHADEVYRIERDDLYLVGTSEVPLAAFHADEIIDLSSGPRRYAGYSACFRREAGSYGKDTRGIFRVHWFDKVEMFSFCLPDDAEVEHQRLLDWEKQFLDKLELHYRVIDVAAGDLGDSAARKYDCEAWFPAQGAYRELTSASNCTTFQARRLGIRFRGDDGKPQPVATLNGTLCAITRTIACLLEHHQRADGSVRVPVALRPHLGGRDVLVPARG